MQSRIAETLKKLYEEGKIKFLSKDESYALDRAIAKDLSGVTEEFNKKQKLSLMSLWGIRFH
ncbi:MAG: hypothetical protein LBL75_02445 [Rickettsiales bacterium]|jgi:hypothetical protein|nr:hypothetical protein [Rickettsiales bacterium]